MLKKLRVIEKEIKGIRKKIEVWVIGIYIGFGKLFDLSVMFLLLFCLNLIVKIENRCCLR